MDWKDVQQAVFGSVPNAAFQPCAQGELAEALRVDGEMRELVERALELFVQLEFLDVQSVYRSGDVSSRQDFQLQKEVKSWKTTVAMKLKRLSTGCSGRQQKHGALCPHLLSLLGAARIKVTLSEQGRRVRPNVDAGPISPQMKQFRAAIVKSRIYREAIALFVDACGDGDTLAYCLQTPELK
jgi:hypothetical protein